MCAHTCWGRSVWSTENGERTRRPVGVSPRLPGEQCPGAAVGHQPAGRGSLVGDRDGTPAALLPGSPGSHPTQPPSTLRAGRCYRTTEAWGRACGLQSQRLGSDPDFSYSHAVPPGARIFPS
ncbi:hypothetical protein HJG60_010302 [Phyllostomus discolor]|uniref:Uncharacterized protein n=1 Tax=Phyllostomus discolor TaxID=89673 RepID=A0A834AZ41_9CHIR|nr:hypothetical protein HJG60_010302 [Phyllostomus discolor]